MKRKMSDILLIDLIKLFAFMASLFFLIVSRPLGILSTVKFMFFFVFLVNIVQMVLLTKEMMKNNKKMVRFMVQFVELNLTMIGFFSFVFTERFNSLCFLWLVPMGIRWYLPKMFNFFQKKRST
ncbi:MAG: hypothetical protein PHO75_00580 [Candidatus Shapirobacteria bacterium]|jgi:hypothetical protein|nr:hypothetical protein [Candidatus Shapirobacteria bacterium]